MILARGNGIGLPEEDHLDSLAVSLRLERLHMYSSLQYDVVVAYVLHFYPLYSPLFYNREDKYNSWNFDHDISLSTMRKCTSNPRVPNFSHRGYHTSMNLTILGSEC